MLNRTKRKTPIRRLESGNRPEMHISGEGAPFQSREAQAFPPEP